jgi:hypothetical protein
LTGNERQPQKGQKDIGWLRLLFSCADEGKRVKVRE